MKYWLGVVCRDHVRRGSTLGIVQLGHGRRDGLARLAAEPNWGYKLRRGLVELSSADFEQIRAAMLAR